MKLHKFNPSKETPTQTLDVNPALTTPAPVAPTIQTALANFSVMPDESFVRLPTVKALYGISSASVWRACKAKKFPLPRKLSDRITAWNVGELRRDLAEKAGVQS